jgi:uncharacterized membrane protein HdeD (DUF308 family)
MFARVSAGLLGAIIIVVGILGFFLTTSSGLLFGIFQVNAVHNIVHIISGLIGIVAAIPNQRRYAAWYVLEMGIIYGLLTVLGFTLNGNIFQLAYFNLNDNLLHAGIAVIAFLLCIFILIDRPEQFTGIEMQEGA